MELEITINNQEWRLLLDSFEDDRRRLQEEETSIRRFAQRSIELTATYLSRLVASVAVGPLDGSDEVLFFKQLKPFVQGHLIFYTRLLKIETERPPAVAAVTSGYYQRVLESLEGVYRDHRFVREYLQSGQTYLDDRLFFRPSADYVIAISGLHPPIDGAMPMCYDHAVAELNAADMLRNYLLGAIADLDLPGRQSGPLPTLTWTKPKAHLVELAYALFASKVFNNGKAQLKDIIETLEVCFNQKTGNYHRIFQEILFRQSGYTVFQDNMRNDYTLYISQIEDKHIG